MQLLINDIRQVKERRKRERRRRNKPSTQQGSIPRLSDHEDCALQLCYNRGPSCLDRNIFVSFQGGFCLKWGHFLFRWVLLGVAKKLRCKFKMVPDPRKRSSQPKEEESHDVVHPPPRLEDLVPRPPVCAIVGHIDHGKTSLLDYLRKSSIVAIEVFCMIFKNCFDLHRGLF